MATLSVERIMDRVSLVVDCGDDAEASEVYQLLCSQILDGRAIRLLITDGAEVDPPKVRHHKSPEEKQ